MYLILKVDSDSQPVFYFRLKKWLQMNNVYGPINSVKPKKKNQIGGLKALAKTLMGLVQGKT